MDASDRERFVRMAEDYDQMAPLLVPKYEWLQQQMLELAGIAAMEEPAVVDLGGGSGRFIERVLEANAGATCTWVDSSEAFLAVARRRLDRYGSRVRYIVSKLEADWGSQVDGPADAICSMSAIHHLERAEKRELYARCRELLKPGGWFINTDEMKSLDQAAYRATLLFWARYVDEQMAKVPAELADHARNWRAHFENWKLRNIDGIDQPKTKGDDLHDPVLDQVQWLREVGYADVDLYVKYQLWCMIGGRRE